VLGDEDRAGGDERGHASGHHGEARGGTGAEEAVPDVEPTEAEEGPDLRHG
jgi:hypothetical protein